jgi:hypothetical protein
MKEQEKKAWELLVERSKGAISTIEGATFDNLAILAADLAIKRAQDVEGMAKVIRAMGPPSLADHFPEFIARNLRDHLLGKGKS